MPEPQFTKLSYTLRYFELCITCTCMLFVCVTTRVCCMIWHNFFHTGSAEGFSLAEKAISSASKTGR